MNRAFEPFFTTKPPGVGTGLGLSQAYGFAKQSGGHIRIYSEIGEGTTIKLYFPRLTGQPDIPAWSAREPAPPIANLDGSETVLVVEDDPQVNKLAVEALEERGYRVLSAPDGPAALRLIEDAPQIDLLLTDVVLPAGMNGRELSDEVRRRRPAIKVLYVTGYTRNAIIHHGRLDPDIDLLDQAVHRRRARRARSAAFWMPARRAPSRRPKAENMPLRSRITTDGLDRTPHRAFMRAMGLDDAAIAKPMIGVVSQKGETTPCNMTHGPQVDAAKEGVAAAGGTPREFTTISVSDGIGMNHEGMKFSLVSRELIADSIEAVMRGHAYDGLVAFGGCDKTLPGAMMGLTRCNLPGVFVYGGAALPGRFAGRDVTVLDAYEGVGAVQTGAMTRGRSRACWSAPASRASAPAPGSSPPTPWRWWPRRSASPCRTPRWCRASMRSGSRSRGAPARS